MMGMINPIGEPSEFVVGTPLSFAKYMQWQWSHENIATGFKSDECSHISDVNHLSVGYKSVIGVFEE
jgi:hypothetical protein